MLKLAEKGLDPNDFDFDATVRDVGHPFSGLETKYKQDKYFKEKLDLIVSIVLHCNPSVIWKPVNDHVESCLN